MNKDADVIVVGGGLAGSAAAVAVARLGFDVIHLAPAAPPDRRTSALMMPSVEFLVESGLVSEPATLGHPLTAIRIIDATSRLFRAPETLFEAVEIGLPAFGWNFGNARLLEHFQSTAPKTGFTIRTESVATYHHDGRLGTVTLADGSTLCAPLVVGADGKKSLLRKAVGITTREHQFTEAALVCDLELTRSVGGTSIEFHYPRGPFTLVPAGENRANLVWIDDEAKLRALQAAGPEALRNAILETSQRLFGDLKIVSPSFVFPLSTLTVDKAGASGVALVGESAHAFPPIGAQGLNLGLRDVADLIAALKAADTTLPDWGAKAADDYARRRAADLAQTSTIVDTLFKSLLADMLPSQTLRAGGLWALKLSPFLRKQAFAVGMGQR
ncbi:FAD-dependent monooxygenase [Devosia sp. WQ 349]|uniref:FAD-dependent monooxygenase n=1 Tax=Devosia sp. WQ 349K1 TaxID=2800329 RepID=UPI001906BCB7|nr:FAD-dependent monooxygenase [Devosia sp. WQ 349K1]MBK1793410.1 FAD-dependent monooxygenase [Devosia sp. WQ 349K1]